MANFKQDIMSAVGKDTIIAVKICEVFSSYYDVDSKYKPADKYAGKIIPYHTALLLLDYEYNSSFGRQECHNILMWSKNYVYYIHEYDGSTSVQCVERNPQIIK